MNDSISILLATTILALGGLGLYMYRSSDDSQKGDDEEYNEEGIFGENFWGFSDNKNDNEENIDENLDEDEDYKPRKRNTKTQKNRKSTGSSRRRY
jgi:hypothetical protein